MPQGQLMDSALMVRGGLLEILPMRIAVDACDARFGFYGLSFWGDNGLTVDQIVDLAGLDHTMVRVSTVGKLRRLGLDPRRSGAYPHLTVRFGVSPSDDELAELASMFDPPIPNPGRAH